MTEQEKEEYKQLRQEYIQTELEYSDLKIKYHELKAKYDELNDFSNSQCANLLKTIAKMKNCENCKWHKSNCCEYCGNIDNCEDYQFWELYK